jgi:hypothetical protein
VLDVGAHRAIGNHQPLRDLTIGQPQRQQRGHLPLTRAQSRDLLRRAIWRPARWNGWSVDGGERKIQRLLYSHVAAGLAGLRGRLSAEGLLDRHEPAVEHGTPHRPARELAARACCSFPADEERATDGREEGGTRVSGQLTARNPCAVIGLACGDEALAERCLGLLNRHEEALCAVFCAMPVSRKHRWTGVISTYGPAAARCGLR